MSKNRVAETFTVGGLHRDDFEWASEEYEEAGYVLVYFALDVDGYHWKAVYLKAETLEKKGYQGFPPTVSLSLPQQTEVPRP